MSNNLFSPVQLGPYKLPNRAAMAPMTRNRAGAGNVPQALNANMSKMCKRMENWRFIATSSCTLASTA